MVDTKKQITKHSTDRDNGICLCIFSAAFFVFISFLSISLSPFCLVNHKNSILQWIWCMIQFFENSMTLSLGEWFSSPINIMLFSILFFFSSFFYLMPHTISVSPIRTKLVHIFHRLNDGTHRLDSMSKHFFPYILQLVQRWRWIILWSLCY